MKQLLKRIPALRKVRRLGRQLRKRYDTRFGADRLRRMAAGGGARKILIGAGSKQAPGWIRTQIEFLDLLKPADWERFFQPDTLDAMLAEHVWEHLTPEEGLEAARTCFKYLKPGGYLRVAVPDGMHSDPTYLGWVGIGGASPMQIANDHKVLYTYSTLSDLFERVGFRVVLHEYFDETGRFHYDDWSPEDGKIWRSRRYDRRNRDGRLVFTSIILDAVKESGRPPD
jgi:predicted SAM-dependent methyltransferase